MTQGRRTLNVSKLLQYLIGLLRAQHCTRPRKSISGEVRGFRQRLRTLQQIHYLLYFAGCVCWCVFEAAENEALRI